MIPADAVCDYCWTTLNLERATGEDGERIYLCRECRADRAYCARRGKEEAQP